MLEFYAPTCPGGGDNDGGGGDDSVNDRRMYGGGRRRWWWCPVISGDCGSDGESDGDDGW